MIGKNMFYGASAFVRDPDTCKIGDGVSIGSHTEVAHHCWIGSGTRIHSKCFICEYTVIEENVWIGPGTFLINDPYPQTGGKYRQSPHVKNKAIIGACCVIMPGVIIGENAVIAAGSLVDKDVPDGECWKGRPTAQFHAQKGNMDAYSNE